MNDSNNLPDDLDALLSARGACDGKGLRESLRGPVTAAFVRRHRRRRARRLLSMAACYALGIATIYAWQQVSASPVEDVDATRAQIGTTSHIKETESVRRNLTLDAPRVVKAEPSLPQPPTSTKPVKKSRYVALRELGDQHLLERDPEQALRCYRVALRYATDEEFTAAAREGTWLLRAICLDSKQEKDHAPQKS